jgi:hypothetical protein
MHKHVKITIHTFSVKIRIFVDLNENVCIGELKILMRLCNRILSRSERWRLPNSAELT